jgi:hypothetical protein
MPPSNKQSKTSPKIWSVIVNWNEPELTIECIDSLKVQTPHKPSIILVDNGSRDGIAEMIFKKHSQIELIKIQDNIGYAPAANLGIERAITSGAEFILLMNNDAVADPNMLYNLHSQYTPDTGILAPVVFFYDLPKKVWSAGGMLRPLLLEKSEDSSQIEDPEIRGQITVERDFVTGCCTLIPASTFNSIGFFDERFRMYYDDADFCYRVRERSLRILLVPTAKAWHRVAASSSGRNTPNERYWMAKSSVLFFRKHATRYQSLFIIPYRTGSAIKTIFGLLAKGKLESARAYLTGLWDGLRY